MGQKDNSSNPSGTASMEKSASVIGKGPRNASKFNFGSFLSNQRWSDNIRIEK